MKILIMGLPGSGKTTLAAALKKYLECNSSVATMPTRRMTQMEMAPTNYKSKVDWFNADEIRKKFNDWDFSKEGRIRQSVRMATFAMQCSGDYVICDFVAPLVEMRENFNADLTIWMDTIQEGRFEDTNKAFVPPEKYHYRITEMNADKWAEIVGNRILNGAPVFDPKKPTTMLLGRYQPWHNGHQALFERALAKTHQVAIMVRDTGETNKKNPFSFEFVKNAIEDALLPLYEGKFVVMSVPNIVNITYGRDVGYLIEQEVFDADIHAISATKIREEMGV
jgi:cytidylate kinase